jgi:hypothetical protein
MVSVSSDEFIAEYNRHLASVPEKFPEELPAGTPLKYGIFHGRRFESVAKLIAYRPWRPEFEHLTLHVYRGLIDGRPFEEDARYVDWRRLAP